MARKGRKPKGAEQKLKDALERVRPAQYILDRRELWSFVTPTKGPEGRTGTIDQDICDGIGQFHALGLLDGHGHDPQDMRDKGREWRDGYATLLKRSGYKTAAFERVSRGSSEARYTNRDAKWDAMDEALTGYERSVLLSLLVDPIVGSWPNGEENAPWVVALVSEALIKRQRHPALVRFPTADDYGRLAATIRGLCLLIDASLPARWEQRAA